MSILSRVLRPVELPRRAVAAALSPFYRVALDGRVPVGVQRSLLNAVAGLQPLPDGTVTRREHLGGVPVERVTVGATERRTVVLYLHGGAYMSGSPQTHRAFTASLAKASGSVLVVADYRLAPEHPYPAALDDAEAVFDAIVANGTDPSRIAIAGDSAGGGLAAATVRRLVDRGIVPAALALVSPWVDPSDQDFPAPRDMLLTDRWLRRSADRYRGAADALDPGYAPARGSLSGFPPTLVHVATTEILHPQVIAFVEALRLAGVDVGCTELPQLWHVAHLQATMMREAAEATDELGAFLAERLAR